MVHVLWFSIHQYRKFCQLCCDITQHKCRKLSHLFLSHFPNDISRVVGYFDDDDDDDDDDGDDGGGRGSIVVIVFVVVDDDDGGGGDNRLNTLMCHLCFWLSGYCMA